MYLRLICFYAFHTYSNDVQMQHQFFLNTNRHFYQFPLYTELLENSSSASEKNMGEAQY